jgi:hypothetical protein
MPFANEREMYPAVCAWLERFLRNKHRGADVFVFDSSRRSLARLIQEAGLNTDLPAEWHSWDIYVDIVGFACTARQTSLAFVECKKGYITLSHLSQLLGYSRVALPQYSLIISPQGASDSLRSLLVTFERTDILHYHSERGKLSLSVAVARWGEHGACIDLGSVISGENNLWP